LSKIEVNTVDIQCGSTLTLGSSGKTVTLATGASQSGFGRTGTVDWCTTAKTSPFTAVSGDGFFVNTTSGGITVTLPSSPSGGDIVAFKDYAGTWNTNNVTICRNGSKINGLCSNGKLEVQAQSVTLIYVDGTKGWLDIQDSTSNVRGAAFITATGGTVTTSGDFKIHTFTSDTNFVVSDAGNSAGSNTVDYLVVGGGGGAGSRRGGGGGAGGYRFSNGTASGCYSAGPSPLGSTALPVSAQTYPISVGGGGAGNNSPGAPNPSTQASAGVASTFSTITSAGGGFGGNNTPPAQFNGGTGGSGGGAGGQANADGGAGNTPPVSPPQGNNGGDDSRPSPPGEGGGGGGGASAVGVNSVNGNAGNGGAGLTSCITASPVARGGGGGGGTTESTPNKGTGGTGGGGNGGSASGGDEPGSNGTANTGGGGGGSGCADCTTGGTGGSGIVIIRYRFQE
jgi:hypothetical protein